MVLDKINLKNNQVNMQSYNKRISSTNKQYDKNQGDKGKAMKSLYFLGMGIPFLFFGCIDPATPLPQYMPKVLEAQGRGITIAKSTPYNCKVLGEIEGKDDTFGAKGAIREKLREGAMNDLRNEAGIVVNPNKRIMLRITNEEVQCRGMVGNETKDFDCTGGIPKDVTNVVLISHRIHAEIFECGDK